MAYRWPADTDFALLELDVLDRDCPVCGRMMYICDHRYRHFHTLDLSFTHISLLTEVLTAINLAAILHNTVHLCELSTEPNENTITV